MEDVLSKMSKQKQKSIIVQIIIKKKKKEVIESIQNTLIKKSII